jgi:ribosome maturation protein SDO1
MTNTTARIKKGTKHFEILVDMDNALKFKKGLISSLEAETNKIFTDLKQGTIASSSDLKTAFGTDDIHEIVQKIVKGGDIEVTQEHRSAEHEAKLKQAVDFISKNAVDPKTGVPHTPDRIHKALEQAHVNIKNVPIENQISEIKEAIEKITSIKIPMKKVRITIPAIYTGKAYGVIAQYKKDENWLNDGSLQVIVEVPSGMIMNFYDKLNAVTHGGALTEDIKN